MDLASLLPLSSLLRDHVTANSQLKLQVGNEGLLYPSHPRLSAPKLLGLTDSSMLFPFTRLYSSPLTHPGGVDLFAYQQLIRESASKFPGMAWYLYDMEFR